VFVDSGGVKKKVVVVVAAAVVVVRARAGGGTHVLVGEECFGGGGTHVLGMGSVLARVRARRLAARRSITFLAFRWLRLAAKAR